LVRRLFGGRFTGHRGGPPFRQGSDRIYIAASTGGVFAERERRRVVDADLRRGEYDDVDGRHGDRAVEPRHRLGGTGEWSNPAHRWGDGVYKSTDAGKTWTLMGLAQSRHIGKIVIDPANPDIVFVAAQGNFWGPSAERGLFKTSDGGRTWKKVLYVDENTGANDVAIDPSNPRVMLASTYTRQRAASAAFPPAPARRSTSRLTPARRGRR
jgi:hypothetical protein